MALPCSDIGGSASCKEEDPLLCQSNKLMMRILIALVLGAIVGLCCHYFENEAVSQAIKPIGETFIKLLKILLGPLFFSTVFMAIVNLRTPRHLCDLGFKTIFYYAFLGVLACFLGLTLMNFVSPGAGVDFPGIDKSSLTNLSFGDGYQNSFSTFWRSLSNIIPTNIFVSFYDGNIIQLMLLAVLLGIISLLHRNTVQPLINLVSSIEKLSMAFINGLMYIAPLGIFALIVDVIAETGFSSLVIILKYFVVVIAGVLFYSIFLLSIAAYLSKKSPLSMLRLVSPLLLTAFSTCSSSASLPLNLTLAQKDLGLNPSVSKFVLSLGSVINVSGTVLYEALAILFLAQVYGIHLSWEAQIFFVLITTFTAIGAAAIPSAGMATISVVLTTLHFPLEAIGLVLCVDCILDQMRTAMSVLGDCTGAMVVERLCGSNSALLVGEGSEV